MYNITLGQIKVLFPLVHFVFSNSLKYILITGGNDPKPGGTHKAEIFSTIPKLVLLLNTKNSSKGAIDRSSMKCIVQLSNTVGFVP